MSVLLIAVFLALVVGLFVLALVEASLLHVRRSQIAVEAVAGDRRAARLLALVDDLPRVMNAVLLAVLLGQVTATTIAGVLARWWFGGSGITFVTIAVTAVLFLYGEAIPKTLAIRRPYAIARRLSGLIRGMVLALRPVVAVLVAVANAQSPVDRTDTVTAVSEDELLHLTDEAAAAGEIDESDAELIERAFTLGDLTAGDVMVPRRDVAGVARGTPCADALRSAIAVGHRRVPVYDTTIDHIDGFVRMRDLARAASGPSPGTVDERMQAALVVPRSMMLIQLLRRMQASDHHLAVVVDEAGRTEGIATIEDVVRQLVGAIDDQSSPTHPGGR